MQVAIARQALDESPHCGDEGGYWQRGRKITLCVADGLGHGEQAEKAAKAAMGYVARHLSDPLSEIFAGCDRAIRHTRGVVMGIAVIDEDAGTLIYAGIGNIHGMIVGEKPTHLSSNYGIVGGGYKTLWCKTVPFMPGDLVILSTDGVSERIDLSDYEDALRADARRLAETILQDWRRGTDDAAVLVFRSEVAG